MTYKVWERRLKRGIKGLPKGERERIAEYYREMFYEMTSGGRTEESVLAEFGSPEKCALQVLTEEEFSAKEGGNLRSVSPARARRRSSPAEVAGLVFFTLLLVLPLTVVALGILTAFGALTLSGGVIGVCGVAFALCFPFSGVSGAAVFSGIGMGVASSGAGLLLFVGFFYATKGMAVALYKALRAVYVRRSR